MLKNTFFKFVPAFLFAFACSFGLAACDNDSSTGASSDVESFNIDDGDFVIGGDSDPLDFIDWGDDESSSSSKAKSSGSSAKSSSSKAKSSSSTAKSSCSSVKSSSSSVKSSSSSVKSSSSSVKSSSSSAKSSSSSVKSSSSSVKSSSSSVKSSSSSVKSSSSSAKSSSSSAKSSSSSAKSSSSSAKSSSSSAKSSSSSVKSSSSSAKSSSSSAKSSSSSAKSSSSKIASSSSKIVDDTESWEVTIVMNETFDDYLNWTLDYTLSTTIVVKSDTNYSMLNGAIESNYDQKHTSFKSDEFERRIVSWGKVTVRKKGSLLAYKDEKSSETILELSFPELSNGHLHFTKTDKIYDEESGKKVVRDDRGAYIIDMPVFTFKLKEGSFDITYVTGDEDVAPENRTDFMAQNKTTVANFRAADEDLEQYPPNVDDGLPVMRFTQSGSGTITIKRLE